jgi:hypothetical protein
MPHSSTTNDVDALAAGLSRTQLRAVASFSNLEAALASEHEAERVRRSDARLLAPRPQRRVVVNHVHRALYDSGDNAVHKTNQARVRPSSSSTRVVPTRSASVYDSRDLGDSGGFLAAIAGSTHQSETESESDMSDAPTGPEADRKPLGVSDGLPSLFGQACSDLHNLLSDTSASWLSLTSSDESGGVMGADIVRDSGLGAGQAVDSGDPPLAGSPVPFSFANFGMPGLTHSMPDAIIVSDPGADVFAEPKNDLLDNFSPPERLPAPVSGNMPIRRGPPVLAPAVSAAPVAPMSFVGRIGFGATNV